VPQCTFGVAEFTLRPLMEVLKGQAYEYGELSFWLRNPVRPKWLAPSRDLKGPVSGRGQAAQWGSWWADVLLRGRFPSRPAPRLAARFARWAAAVLVAAGRG
jgi:hypothetical protein